MTDVVFTSMGSEARLVLDGAPLDAELLARRFLDDFETRLTRFTSDSELSTLNASKRESVPASPLLRRAVRAGVWAAERTRGLVDPTVLPELVAAGYDRTRRSPELSLLEALAEAPARRPAHPDPRARWQQIDVDDTAGVVRRPPGVRFDSGGTGKGLAADLLAARLRDADRVAVDLGGDIRVTGLHTASEPFALEIRHPLTGECAESLTISAGGVATSGLDVRLWRDREGRPAHHLLDPASGRPAWTGVIGVTALAPTALEADVLAKAALLSGKHHARRWLDQHGGLVFHENGDVQRIGALRPRYVVRLPQVAR